MAPSLETAEAAGLFDAGRVDVVLLDIRLGTDSGLRALTRLGRGRGRQRPPSRHRRRAPRSSC